MSLLEKTEMNFNAAPLPTTERALAASAASFALSSKPEVLKTPELSQAEKIALFAKWITALRGAAATDTEPALVDERQLTQDMLDLAA